MAFKKAIKLYSFLRGALFGPAGSGKTMSALRIATGMLNRMKELGMDVGNGRIAVADTERGSASLYADRFDFDVDELNDDHSVERVTECLVTAARDKYPVFVLDSGSHAWAQLLEEIDQLAKAKYGGNSWAAWKDGTPRQRKFIDALLAYPGHIIFTMRSKTEWLTESNERGKMMPVRVGTTPEQGKGIEYEFTFLMQMSVDHICQVIKDRTGKFQDRLIEKPGEEFGAELIDWLMSAEAPATKDQIQRILRIAESKGIQPGEIKDKAVPIIDRTFEKSSDLTAKEADAIIEAFSKLPAPEQPEPKPQAEAALDSEPADTIPESVIG